MKRITPGIFPFTNRKNINEGFYYTGVFMMCIYMSSISSFITSVYQSRITWLSNVTLKVQLPALNITKIMSLLN